MLALHASQVGGDRWLMYVIGAAIGFLGSGVIRMLVVKPDEANIKKVA